MYDSTGAYAPQDAERQWSVTIRESARIAASDTTRARRQRLLTRQQVAVLASVVQQQPPGQTTGRLTKQQE